MKLYEMTEQFNELFDQFDDINNYTPDQDESGHYVDGNGEIIPDLEAFREKLRNAWFDTLTALEDEFESKAENVAVYLKSVFVEIAAMKDEEAALRRRRQNLEKNMDAMQRHLIGAMNKIGLKKIEMPRARITIRNNGESLAVDNEEDFIEWAKENAMELLKFSAPSIKKTDTKRLLQKGENIPFVHLTRTQSLIIK